jgi:hypothetical protein
MRRSDNQNSPGIEELGRLDIGGNRAIVTWPMLGDGVALDFPDLRARFGIVAGLDRDPRLNVDPGFANLLDLEGRLGVLEAVSAMWIQRALRESAVLEAEVRS